MQNVFRTFHAEYHYYNIILFVRYGLYLTFANQLPPYVVHISMHHIMDLLQNLCHIYYDVNVYCYQKHIHNGSQTDVDLLYITFSKERLLSARNNKVICKIGKKLSNRFLLFTIQRKRNLCAIT